MAVAFVVIAALLVSVALGLVAQALGSLVRMLWIGQWPWPLRAAARRLAVRRRGRWTEADQEIERLVLAAPADTTGLTAALHRRNGISLAPPVRPTWIGDRLAGVDARVRTDYQVQLAVVWPRLWLVLPEDARTEVRAAASGFDATARLAAWGLLYLAVGAAWWPAAPVGAGVVAAGWWRGRGAAAGLADLLESVVDLYGADLARKLGVGDEKTTLTPEIGTLITERIRKGA